MRTAGEQATAAVNAVLEQVRTPLLAALGAGDLAGKAVADALNKAKLQVNERAEAAKAAVDDLPSDLGGLREKLDPSELRKLLDVYTEAAANLYGYLAEHGKETLDKLRAQPRVKQALDQVEAAQHRAEDLAEDVLGKVAMRTRSAGEKVARATEDSADSAAATTRSATRKAANKVAAPAKPANRRSTGAKAKGN
ncbi:MAG: hypothetical protein JOZ47_10500 [Kutzneria sp.]|nr:hypothetical protein [Kutzneria sp.]MBV9845489.1 hypothetical protein [Kutzneria sp.]